MPIMNYFNSFAFNHGFKFPAVLGILIIVLISFLTASNCPAESPPRAANALAGIAPSDTFEYGTPPVSETINSYDEKSDIDDVTPAPSEQPPDINPLPELEKKLLDPIPREENRQNTKQDNVDPETSVKDRRTSGLESPGSTPDKNAKGQKSRQKSGSGPSRLIGGTFVYLVKKRESLRMVGAKMGTDWRIIAKENRLDPTKNLEPGQKILIDNRKIVPKFMQDGIVINIPDRTLYLFRDNQLAKALPVGLGRKQQGRKADWRTPTGKFSIVGKQKNPTWHVPPSIRKEMQQTGKTVKVTVPPGNRNPLGKYAMRTSLSGVLIHSTIFPESVYGFSSHGCIRMLPGNIEELFNDVNAKTNGEIIYQPVKMAVTGEGRIFLEVHADVYNRRKNLENEVERLIAANGAGSRVDWDKIRTSLKSKSGKAEEVTLASDAQFVAQTAK